MLRGLIRLAQRHFHQCRRWPLRLHAHITAPNFDLRGEARILLCDFLLVERSRLLAVLLLHLQQVLQVARDVIARGSESNQASICLSSSDCANPCLGLTGVSLDLLKMLHRVEKRLALGILIGWRSQLIVRQAQHISLAHHARLPSLVAQSESLAVERAWAAQSCRGTIVTATHVPLIFVPVFL